MFLNSDLQTSPLLKSDKIEFLVRKDAQCSETGRVPINPPPLPLKSGYIDIKDAQCAETNEKSIFRCLGF